MRMKSSSFLYIVRRNIRRRIHPNTFTNFIIIIHHIISSIRMCTSRWLCYWNWVDGATKNGEFQQHYGYSEKGTIRVWKITLKTKQLKCLHWNVWCTVHIWIKDDMINAAEANQTTSFFLFNVTLLYVS